MNTVFELIGNDNLNMELSHFNNVVSKISQSKGSGEINDDSKFFNNNWMPFVMAALYGFKHNISRPLTGDIKTDVFKFIQIYRGSDKLFKLLVLNVVNLHGYKVLDDKVKIKNTIEEFANGGFDFLSEKIKTEDKFLMDIDFLEFISAFQKDA